LDDVGALVRNIGEGFMDAESAVFSQIVGNAFSTRLAAEKQ
jgi:hypothetical protein